MNSKILRLTLEFMRFGCFTFGGGWSIIAQMQQLYVEKRKTITTQELMDLTSVAKSLPGAMVANVAMLYGYRTAGFAGGAAAVLGLVLPPMGILIAISFFYQAFRSNFWISAIMEGMQAAVVPIIASAAVGLVKGSFTFPPCVLVAVGCAAAYLLLEINPIVLVLFGVVSGLIISGYYERKGDAGHGAA